MICQVCKKHEATIHLTEIAGGKRAEMHLCQACAIEQGVAVKSQMPINELLSSLLDAAPTEDEISTDPEKDLICPSCGITLEQFRKNALLGCPDDYEVFEKALTPLIEKAQDGHTTHCGKIPAKTPGDTKKQVQLLNLRQQLDNAVKTEDYEQAAKLRDQINELEN